MTATVRHSSPTRFPPAVFKLAIKRQRRKNDIDRRKQQSLRQQYKQPDDKTAEFIDGKENDRNTPEYKTLIKDEDSL